MKPIRFPERGAYRLASVSTLVAIAAAAGPLVAQDSGVGDVDLDPPADSTAGAPSLGGGIPSALELPPQDEPPPNFAAAELARSRECVPVLSRLDAMATELQPRQERARRIEALHRAVTVEDSARVSPLAEDDPLERAVAEWFRADLELARRYLETEDESIREERSARRAEILERLEQAYQEVSREAEEIVGSNEDLQGTVQGCQGRVFVRSAVEEACASQPGESPLCQAAATEEQASNLRFVDSPEDLWNMERLRPWTEPAPIRPTPAGGLGGGRTASLARRGNSTVVIGVEPLIRPRANLTEEEAALYEANLDSLGYGFDHPGFVMAPALTFEIDMPARLGGETHYLLHFGGLDNPEGDVFRTVAVPDQWPIVGAFSPREETLVRLARGDPVSLTAVRMSEDGSQGEAVFSIGLTPVLQSQRVTAVLQYMFGGQLESDLLAIFPPESMDAPADSATTPRESDEPADTPPEPDAPR